MKMVCMACGGSDSSKLSNNEALNQIVKMMGNGK